LEASEEMARILIVEDDQWQRKLLRAFLVSLGHETIELEEASQAISVIKEHRPDILLLDWGLPGISGLELCKEIRRRTDLPYVYIIFLTASNDQNRLAEALRAGGDDFVSKPANPIELQARITAGLRILEAARLDKQRIEEQLRQSQKMESIGRLVGGIAHDFNNLLTIINGYAQFAQFDLPPESPIREIVSTIESAGNRAALLTKQLLTFSRKSAPSPIPLNLNEQISAITRMVERIVGENIQIETQLEPKLWQTTIDPSSIDQVIMNLVVNARDAMPRGGRITLSTSNLAGATPEQDLVEMTIADTGTGMTEEVRQRLFEPFFSTKGDKGTGLGLATVFDVVSQAAGSIELDSELGKGSIFRIRLPRTQVSPRAISNLDFTALRTTGGERILVVEDDRNVLKWARMTLERAGYEVFAAESAATALNMFRAEKGLIDCVLADVMLPDSTGPDLVEKLRVSNGKLRAVFMSGYPKESLDARTTILPSDPFLEKPLRATDLIEKVSNIDHPARKQLFSN
jgi:two-component system, cell cycle sensor histidine kinase and response regulator CckA